MPWWSWLLIWTVLTLGLLAVLSWFAVSLFRTARGTLQALESFHGQLPTGEFDRPTAASVGVPAVFADSAVLLGRVEQLRAERTHRSQVRRDARIVRGKLLGHAR
ncbi:hypothetical protein [Cryobacterium sp. PH31-L1]|uniref:hypothetical protein n=1 Tax=Cryobacterium sp. PH31-L1 TaxID=3046199 RepID=UPI0024BB9C0E|nr:hypothetical protein [Cryobacterium sp. PH31-L1]MDJ0377701.1 hypothetical protein [Cryobacterium sp. PH31-L1]